MAEPPGFVRCSIRCRQCASTLASIDTLKQTVPRGRLSKIARSRGAVTNEAGDWFCGPGCKTTFALTHNIKPKDLP